ncbi:MAG: hypothetical protein F6K40_23270 [Okeania sp. SIO3I5]|uniref:hypothetical protein n=1 Tax=Okeania sp. SIO3I5 TaxID=2607805 RepID=UPI0013B816C0|nr:hypothetical protein [Okeania sp. SIO3I5]NEQ39023.1 hypothetical protein [Okeania sp. SIO3I5]
MRQGSVGRVGSVGSVGSVGRLSKVGAIIVPVSFWEVSAIRPNFLVLKTKKFTLFSLQKSSSFYISVLLDYISQPY